MFEPPSFSDALARCVAGYEGAHSEAVLLAPDVFEFFARLYAEPELPLQARGVVSAVLAYFVAPHDILPEDELGPFGLLDDLYVAVHAYSLLRKELSSEFLEHAWKRRGKSPPQSVPTRRPKQDDGAGDLESTMAVLRTECRLALGKSGRSALKMAGLG